MSDELVARIQALIAKAENSPYPAEADAFMAKAQAMMQRHAIDEVRLHGAAASTIGQEELPMSGSYTRERCGIWSAVARANRCQILTWSKHGSSSVVEMTLVGRGRDRELTKVLASSLEIQGVRRMHELDLELSWEAPVVQRRSFLRGFANELNRRLDQANQQAHAHGATAAALVLASEAVDQYVDRNFDLANRRSQARIDHRAYSQGRRAGSHADVGTGHVTGRQAALGPGR